MINPKVWIIIVFYKLPDKNIMLKLYENYYNSLSIYKMSLFKPCYFPKIS